MFYDSFGLNSNSKKTVMNYDGKQPLNCVGKEAGWPITRSHHIHTFLKFAIHIRQSPALPLAPFSDRPTDHLCQPSSNRTNVESDQFTNSCVLLLCVCIVNNSIIFNSSNILIFKFRIAFYCLLKASKLPVELVL